MSVETAAEDAFLAAVRARDETAAAALLDRHRRELQVHCYRMLGSFEDAEDLVQETFLRAWRNRASFAGRSSVRAWLYRIATNGCLDALERRPRRVLPPDVAPPADPRSAPAPAADLPWLQPFPDRLLEPGPEEEVVARETIELAFLAAIQLLPPRQRAALIAREALGWSAKETAALLGTSVVAVNSALQRARSALQEHLPRERLDWAPAAPTGDERELLDRYLEAHGNADASALAALMHEDARMTMPPKPTWFDGRAAIEEFHARHVFSPRIGHKRAVATAANRQPALAVYLRRPGDTEYRALAIDVLRIERGAVAEITAFVSPQLFPAFGLPPTI
jgi:RNA polymerase sigma-70 factor (ECF subfamily)